MLERYKTQMSELTIMCTTRNRPKSARRAYRALQERARADTRMVMIVDADDPTLGVYYTLLNGVGSVITVEPGRRGMVAATNEGYDMIEHTLGFALMWIGDDHVFETDGFDERYLEELHAMGTGFVYGDDGFQHEVMPTQVAMTSDIPKAIGYLSPPCLDHLDVDIVWRDWGQAIDRIKYLPDVIVRHHHPLAGFKNMDAGYAAVNSGEMAKHDHDAYFNYKDNGGLAADVEKLRCLL